MKYYSSSIVNYVIIIFFSGLVTHPSFGMQLVVNLEEQFKADPVSTEWKAYEVLRNKPLAQHVTYCAIPWARLIANSALARVPAIRCKGGFTICQHVAFEKIIPTMKRVGLDTLFTPHAEKRKNYGITVLPFPHFAVNGTGPAEKKDIMYSFIGFDTHEARKKIFAMIHPDNTVVKKRNVWHFWSRQQQKEKKEYQDVLARSRYSLCPRGFGPSTLRFWESLQAGAIPVLIGNDMWLPEPFDWSSCVVMVQEDEIEKIPTILRAISIGKEEKMRQMSLEAYRMFSGNNFVSPIRYYYQKKTNRTDQQ